MRTLSSSPLRCSARSRPVRRSRQSASAQAANRGELRSAGPEEPPPDYTSIDRQPLNRAIMALFRNKMVAALGQDSTLQGYDAIIDLTRTLNSKHKGARRRVSMTCAQAKAEVQVVHALMCVATLHCTAGCCCRERRAFGTAALLRVTR